MIALIARRVLPAQDGPVSADADDGLLVGADAQSIDFSAVADTDVGHTAVLVIPELPKKHRGDKFCRRSLKVVMWFYLH